MNPLQDRANEARAKVVPILKEFNVDIGSEPFLENGVIKSRVVWVEGAAPKEQIVSQSEVSPEVSEAN